MTNRQEKKTHIYISEKGKIIEGEQAALLIDSKTKDAEKINEEGVISVNKSRWLEAQEYEKRTWLESGIGVSSDRNEHHLERFANFSSLQGFIFERGIELGCGPFTNLRYLSEKCDVKDIHLLDPLINDYLGHPFCWYRNSLFGGLFKNKITIRNFRHPIKLWRRILTSYRLGGLFGKKVILENSMIEEFRSEKKFDLVVMVNVIEHCQDIHLVFDKVLQLLSPEGIFVFADRIYLAKEVKNLSSILYDAGHPLRVDYLVINNFLDKNFEKIMKSEYFGARSFRGVNLTDNEFYFIGRYNPVK